MPLRVLSAIIFYPRGGSSHAARALARGMRAAGCEVTLVSGSRSDLGGDGDARSFYGEVHSVSFDAALSSDRPLSFEGPPGTAPLHPSFEERPGAPDDVFASLDDAVFEQQVRAWSRELLEAGVEEADVLHLHHLTPLNEAAARVAPRVPVVGQLHGTELLMLEQIDAGAPASWTHAERWAERLRGWAARCERLVAVPGGVDRAAQVLGLPRERFVPLPNGVDVEAFRPIALDRHEFWHHVLVDDPQGWLPGQDAGSTRYEAADVARLAEGTILLYVGRFTAVKRLGLLLEAYGTARARIERAAGLVLVGGHPGEWEGEHPAELAARLQIPDVYLAGWYPQEALPRFLSASDVMVLTSQREQFGLVLVEAMACGTPVVATRSVGPESIVEDGRTGWLTRGDPSALVPALLEAITNDEERERRARLARVHVREHFSWNAIASTLADLLERTAADVAAA